MGDQSGRAEWDRAEADWADAGKATLDWLELTLGQVGEEASARFEVLVGRLREGDLQARRLMIGCAQFLVYTGGRDEPFFDRYWNDVRSQRFRQQSWRPASSHAAGLVQHVDRADRRSGRRLDESWEQLDRIVAELDDDHLIGWAWQLRLAAEMVYVFAGDEALQPLIDVHRGITKGNPIQSRLPEPAALIVGAVAVGEVERAWRWLALLLTRRPAARVGLPYVWIKMASMMDSTALMLSADRVHAWPGPLDVEGLLDFEDSTVQDAVAAWDLSEVPSPRIQEQLEHINTIITTLRRNERPSWTALSAVPVREKVAISWLLALSIGTHLAHDEEPG